MRKGFLIIALTLGLGGVIFIWLQKPEKMTVDIPPSTVVLPSPTLVRSENIIDFEKDGMAYRAAWVETSDFKNLFLYPNFGEKLSAQKLMEQKKCRSLVSAGFYTEDDEPVGLFVSEGEVFRKRIESRLFDGVFFLENDKAQITLQTPDGIPRLALQSGPVLLLDGRQMGLKIRDDKPARRVVLALGENGRIYFVIIYNKDSVLEGPYLANLPEVVKSLEGKAGFEFRDAINLDGGSASAFYTDFLTLSEFSSIGSYFCLNT
ncbi:MAG: phosphodiester glycosidase family protein [bacterium]|nr:phosphodiester glycosidase family protein [bacterium]